MIGPCFVVYWGNPDDAMIIEGNVIGPGWLGGVGAYWEVAPISGKYWPDGNIIKHYPREQVHETWEAARDYIVGIYKAQIDDLKKKIAGLHTIQRFGGNMKECSKEKAVKILKALIIEELDNMTSSELLDYIDEKFPFSIDHIRYDEQSGYFKYELKDGYPDPLK